MNTKKIGYIGSLFGLIFSASLFFIHNCYLSLLFLAIAVIAFVVAIFTKNKTQQGINLKEFTFIDPPGYYKHPKYSYPICPSCLTKTKIISPVSKEGYCTVCKEPMSGTLGEVFTVPDV